MNINEIKLGFNGEIINVPLQYVPEACLTKYEKRKTIKVCTRCGKQDDRTLSGFVNCIPCTEKQNENSMKNRRIRNEKKKKLGNESKSASRID